jgi:hypothetical protein
MRWKVSLETPKVPKQADRIESPTHPITTEHDPLQSYRMERSAKAQSSPAPKDFLDMLNLWKPNKLADGAAPAIAASTEDVANPGGLTPDMKPNMPAESIAQNEQSRAPIQLADSTSEPSKRPDADEIGERAGEGAGESAAEPAAERTSQQPHHRADRHHEGTQGQGHEHHHRPETPPNTGWWSWRS